MLAGGFDKHIIFAYVNADKRRYVDPNSTFGRRKYIAPKE
jgi:hypothetical protein